MSLGIDPETKKYIDVAIRSLKDQIEAMEHYKNPLTTEGRLDLQNMKLEQLENLVTGISQKLQSYDRDERYLELFKDEQLREMYISSGVTSQQVKEFLQKARGIKDMTDQAVGPYLNGVIKDPFIRNQLGKFYRMHIVINERKRQKA